MSCTFVSRTRESSTRPYARNTWCVIKNPQGMYIMIFVKVVLPSECRLDCRRDCQAQANVEEGRKKNYCLDTVSEEIQSIW